MALVLLEWLITTANGALALSRPSLAPMNDSIASEASLHRISGLVKSSFIILKAVEKIVNKLSSYFESLFNMC